MVVKSVWTVRALGSNIPFLDLVTIGWTLVEAVVETSLVGTKETSAGVREEVGVSGLEIEEGSSIKVGLNREEE